MKKKILVAMLTGAMLFTTSPVLAEEAATETTEEKAGELSDDIYSFQIKLDGDVYTFPMSYEEFISHGWEYTGDDAEQLQPNQYSGVSEFKKGNLEIYTDIANLGINTAPVSECIIAGFSIDDYQWEKAPETALELPKGILYGKATLDEIKAAYGEASDVYESDLYTKLTYSYDYYREIELYVDAESGVLNEIDLQNMVIDEEANEKAKAEVNKEPTEEVLAYQAPNELSDDPMEYTAEFGGNVYKLPAPVSVFLENGFSLRAEDSEDVVAGKSSGWVTMMKDNQEFRAMAYNYNPNAAVIENCFVTSISGDVYNTNLQLKLFKGITAGMTREDLEKALEGINYEETESGENYTYFNIEDPDSSLDGYHFAINNEEKQVVDVEIEYRPSELK